MTEFNYALNLYNKRKYCQQPFAALDNQRTVKPRT